MALIGFAQQIFKVEAGQGGTFFPPEKRRHLAVEKHDRGPGVSIQERVDASQRAEVTGNDLDPALIVGGAG